MYTKQSATSLGDFYFYNNMKNYLYKVYIEICFCHFRILKVLKRKPYSSKSHNPKATNKIIYYFS